MSGFKMRIFRGVVLAATLANSSSVWALDEQALLRRLEAVERENATLKKRIAKIEHQEARKSKPAKHAESRAIVAANQTASIVIPEGAPQESGFAGFYGGVNAGGALTLSNPYSGNTSLLRGTNYTIAFGYNVVRGDLFLGLEARASKSFSRAVQNKSFGWLIGPLPMILGSETCYGCSGVVPMFPAPTSFTFGQTTHNRYAFSKDYGFDLSFRPGVIINDFLFFSRVGLGIEHFTLKSESWATTNNCTAPETQTTSGRDSWSMSLLGCNKMKNDNTYTNISTQAFVPYSTISFGAEHNFDRYFIRGEFGMNYYMFARNSVGIPAGFGEFAASAGAGIRF